MSMVAEQARLGHGLAGPDPDGWCQRIALLEDENAALRDREQQLEREQRQLRERIGRLEAERERLQAEGERLQGVNARLREQVEALRRAAKRQAAPFSRGDPKPNPRRAGRKPGAAHGRHAHRQPPEQVDRVVVVGLRDGCPGCGGELVLERVAAQYVEELPQPRPLRIRYDLHIGRCRRCGRRVQPHPAQTSDTLGAAGAQLGPRRWRAGGLAVQGAGISTGKIARLLAQLGIQVTAGGSARRSRRPPRPVQLPGAGHRRARQPGGRPR
jgi:transposase